MGGKSSKLSKIQVHAASNQIELQKASEIAIVEDFVIIWLDANIDESLIDFQNSIKQLRQIVNSIIRFKDEKQCIQFIRGIKDEKIFLIVSGSLGERTAASIHELIQLDSIYVFCCHKSAHEQWARRYSKVKGVFTDINSVCLRLKQDVRQTNNDLTLISIVSKLLTIELNTLDPLFMYSELIKEIIRETKFDDKVRKEFIHFCRSRYSDNSKELQLIDKFEREYNSSVSIEWYTRDCFIYSMLNKALRTMDIETIYQMGFYIQDLLEQIEQIYIESKCQSRFVVWRGQGMSIADFEKLQTNKGGLLSFNSFLSTSTLRSVACRFAEFARVNNEMRAILFQIQIDPSISPTPFADLHYMSFFQEEKEILFSMHTVFRIEEVKKTSDGIWQVNLTSTTKNDPQLRSLTDCMRKEIEGGTSLHRLAYLMHKMKKFDHAKKIYEKLLRMTSDHDRGNLAFLHNQIGCMDFKSNDLESALAHYEESLRLYLTILSPDNPRLAAIYSNMGLIFQRQEKLSTAREHFQRALEIDLKASHPDQPKIATYYNNIAWILKAQGEYAAALKLYEKALKIRQTLHPATHPSIAVVYSNMGKTHCSMKNYSTALSYYHKTLEVRQKSLLPNDPSLADTYFDIAMTLDDLHRSKEAIEYAAKAVTIAQAHYAADHSQVQTYERYLHELQRKVEAK